MAVKVPFPRIAKALKEQWAKFVNTDQPKYDQRSRNRCFNNALVADGGTAGKIKTTNAISYSLADQLYSKAATDNFWDLSGQTDTIANQYRGYRLMIDASGAASFTATANVVNAVEATAQAAVRALLLALADVASKTVVAEVIIGPETDFSMDAILGNTGSVAYQGYSGAPTRTTEEVAVLQ